MLKTHMIDTQGDLQPGGSRRILTTSKPGAVGKQLLQRLTWFFADQDRTTAGEEVCPYGEWVETHFLFIGWEYLEMRNLSLHFGPSHFNSNFLKFWNENIHFFLIFIGNNYFPSWWWKSVQILEWILGFKKRGGLTTMKFGV